MNISSSRKQRGMTLFEILVGVTISAIAGVLLLLILVSNNGLFVSQTSKIAQGLGLNDATTLISDDLRFAASIINSFTYQGQTYLSGATTLILKVPSVDSSGNIIDQEFDTFIYALETSNPAIFRRLVVPSESSSRLATNRVVMTDVSTISFVYLDNSGAPVSPTNATKINFSLTFKKSPFSTTANTAAGEVRLRNN